MTADPKGRGLFIVDNSISGWTGLRYLEEWAGIAKAFDKTRDEQANGLYVLVGLYVHDQYYLYVITVYPIDRPRG